jgi:hypothetical protein
MEDNNKINEMRASILREIFGNPVQSLEHQKMMADFMSETIEDIREGTRFRKFEQERLEKEEKRLEESHAAYLAELKDVQNHRKNIEKTQGDFVEHQKTMEALEERQTVALEYIGKILSLGIESTVLARISDESIAQAKKSQKKTKKAY